MKPSNLLPFPLLQLSPHFSPLDILRPIRFRVIIRRQFDPSGVLPPLPERTQTFGIYLTRGIDTLIAQISDESCDESLLGCLLREDDTRPSISLFFFPFSFLFLSPFFVPFLLSGRRHSVDTEPAHFDKHSNRYCRSMDFTLVDVT